MKNDNGENEHELVAFGTPLHVIIGAELDDANETIKELEEENSKLLQNIEELKNNGIYILLVTEEDGLKLKVGQNGVDFYTLMDYPSLYMVDGSKAKISHCSLDCLFKKWQKAKDMNLK